MIWLYGVIVLLCACLWRSEAGWAAALAERDDAEETAKRLRIRNQRMAALLWADPVTPRMTRIVARSDAEAIDALLADLTQEAP